MLFSALERKISVRANREELVQKGILLPESPITAIAEPPGTSRDQPALPRRVKDMEIFPREVKFPKMYSYSSEAKNALKSFKCNIHSALALVAVESP